jgi:hypothetical protein
MSNLFKLTKKINGKVIVDCIDTLKIVNARKKALSSSYRGQKVELEVIPVDDEEKYRKPPVNGAWRGGDYPRVKDKIKRNIKSTKRKNKNA